MEYEEITYLPVAGHFELYFELMPKGFYLKHLVSMIEFTLAAILYSL